MCCGVPNICVACPHPVPEILGTAHLLGVSHVFQMGGAQTIAAFAYGTRSVPRADRIVQPDDVDMAAAKKLLAGDVGIQFVASPPECLIISADGNPRHLAADMLAQAEHDVDAAAILLTTSKRLANAVAKESTGSLRICPPPPLRARPSSATAPSCWSGRLQMPSTINRFAPEHLSIRTTGR